VLDDPTDLAADRIALGLPQVLNLLCQVREVERTIPTLLKEAA